eukprot:TRINITY_DN1843_c0_g1_i1.p1 TRINITY_DN1843_c0_g1~~TRINITY_DN1843_c0_g1_i1.p1  ORF type:complete len:679 (-),score=89.89 TRINITY_DN1843_c0_g1_i1:548-2542(-)
MTHLRYVCLMMILILSLSINNCMSQTTNETSGDIPSYEDDDTLDNTCFKILYGLYTNITAQSLSYMQATGLTLGSMGNYYECIAMEHSRFCVVSIEIDIPDVPIPAIQNGFCVPDGCNASSLSDAIILMERSSLYFGDIFSHLGQNFSQWNITDASENYTAVFPAHKVSCEDPRQPTTGYYVMMIFIISLVAINVIASIADWATSEFEGLRKNILVNLLFSFSTYSNAPRLKAPVPTSTKVFNGFRTLMMCYVIFGHTNIFLGTVALDDFTFFFKDVYPTFAFQTVTGGFFAVDAFFFLSAFLLTFLLLEQIQSKSSIDWIIVYLHRFLRLTPTYLFMLLVFTYIYPQLGSGPYYYFDDVKPIVQSCVDYWWTNILYINNIFPWTLGEECIGWGWYLANDMQFFLITPPLLLLYVKKPALSIISLCSLFVGSAIAIGSISISNNFTATTSLNEEYSNLIYTKPWGRIGPYIVGVLFGIFVNKFPNVNLGRVKRYICYIVGVGLIFVMIYSPYYSENWSTAVNILYICLSRSLFVFGMGLLCVTCYYGHGGIFRFIFCSNIFTVTARLTFSAYLVHPIIQFIFYKSTTKQMTWHIYSVIIYFIGFSVLSYFVAFCLYCLFEKPVMNIEKIIVDLFVKSEPEEKKAEENAFLLSDLASVEVESSEV